MKLQFLAVAAALAVLVPQDESQDQPQDQPQEKPALPSEGDVAPAFRLNDHTGKAVEVGGESKRWTVVAFFPRAATPG
ncbi:MAG: hypothetical protein V3T22_00665 [Planctomycetota bacterium]